jgi:argininosuccinate lyase
MKNLPSGYNRDLQETKKSLIESIDTTKECLTLMDGLIPKIGINENIIRKSLSNEIFATHHAISLTKKGTPYKEAYRIIGKKLKKGEKIPTYEVRFEMGNYHKILKEKESKIQGMEKVFISKIESLINTARQISNM